MSLLNTEHANAHQGLRWVVELFSLRFKCFLPAQREETGPGARWPCPRGRQMSENSQEVHLQVLREHY